jgi:hypothetical protein
MNYNKFNRAKDRYSNVDELEKKVNTSLLNLTSRDAKCAYAIMNPTIFMIYCQKVHLHYYDGQQVVKYCGLMELEDGTV